jgi:polysaccharide export outer membrane protein
MSASVCVALIVLLGMAAGCETQSFFDPSEMGKYSKTPLLVPILDNLDTGYSEDLDARFVNATPVRPADLIPVEDDYAIAANDLLQISITDLVAPGVETYKTQRVTQSGNISLPYIGQVRGLGLTEAQLEEAIAQAYKDKNIIQNAQVSVTTVEARGRTFSILGAVNSPGQYVIVQSDFRLLDALVLARDVTSIGVTDLYIIRKLDSEPGADVVTPENRTPATQPGPDLLTPQSRGKSQPGPAQAQAPARKIAWLKTQDPMPTPSDPATQPVGDREGRIIIIEDKPVQVDGMTGEPVPAIVPPLELSPPAPDAPAKPFEFNEPTEPTHVRVIKVPVDALKRGELRYNVVVRPQDMIVVPDPPIGEYYMGGHVQRTGVYSLTARKITLKQAVISAGMLDQLAMPYRTQVIRRVGDREIFARVDLSKIFAGEEPDIFLKPYDQVMVGTNAFAPFLAAARNGFRITYGFGFLYDRNYAPDNNSF